MNWPARLTPAFSRIGSLVGIVLGLIISQRQSSGLDHKAAERESEPPGKSLHGAGAPTAPLVERLSQRDVDGLLT